MVVAISAYPIPPKVSWVLIGRHGSTAEGRTSQSLTPVLERLAGSELHIPQCWSMLGTGGVRARRWLRESDGINMGLTFFWSKQADASLSSSTVLAVATV